MRWIRFCVRSPYLVIVAVLLTTFFGVLAIGRIPIQLIPTVDRPIITVSVEYRGAAPQEIEDQITDPLEEQLNSVENLRELTSSSAEGSSTITLEFDWGTDKDVATIDILKRLNLVADLPEEADEPVVTATTGERIMWVVASSTTMRLNDLYQLAEDVIQPRLERCPGVGSVEVYGGEERELKVLLDPERLAARSLTPLDVARALDAENRNLRAGYVEEGRRHVTIRTTGQFQSPEDVLDVILARDGIATVRLRDVGDVFMGHKEARFYVRQTGVPSLAMPVERKSDTNTLEVTRSLHEAIAELNEQLAQQGDITIKPVYDESQYIWGSIDNVVQNLLLGAFLAAAVLLVFLHAVRPTILAALSIPICIIATFFVLYAFQRSINLISLAGLAFAAGMVVDNCIVVLEAIVTRLERGEDPTDAAIEGAREVWAPLNASTLTTLAVFLPIVFVQEEAGQLFRDLALTIAFAVGLSLVVALSFIPMAAARMLRPRAAADGAAAGGGTARAERPRRLATLAAWSIAAGRRLAAPIEGSTRWLMERSARRAAFIGLVLVAFVVSVIALPPAEYLPQGGRNMILLFVKLPVGTNLEQADRFFHDLETRVRAAVPELDRYFVVVRRSGPVMGVILKDEAAGRVPEVQGRLWGVTAGIPGASVFVTRASILGRGSSGGNTLEITLRGPDLERLGAYEQQVKQALSQADAPPEQRTFQRVDSSFDLGNPELSVVVNRERAADLGLTVSDVASYVEILTEGRPVSVYRAGGEEIDITLEGRAETVQSVDELENAQLFVPGHGLVALSEVARLERELGPVTIEHDELERAIRITGYVSEGVALETAIDRADELALDAVRADMPLGYDVKLAGTAGDLERTRGALEGSFAVALVVIYLVLVALFESFLFPLVILSAVPLAVTGAMLGILGTGEPLNVIAMLGFVILAGVVVNNSILLVDRALAAHREGASPVDAVLDAVRVRMRPIFMSTTTSVLGMLPLALGTGEGTELYRGLGAAVVGGLALSTVFTLVLTPILTERALAWFGRQT